MPVQPEGSRELVLNEGQYAFIQDTTKGPVNVFVGPYKSSLSTSDQPLKWDGKKFVNCEFKEAIADFPVAGEGSYLVLDNPAAEATRQHPPTGNNQAIGLSWGRRIIVPGPVRFPLWPGQSIQVIPGHQLRTNEYVVAVVTNGKEATENWPKAVLLASQPAAPPAKPAATSAAGGTQTPGSDASGAGAPPAEGTPPAQPSGPQAPASVPAQPVEFVTGQRIIIRGTQVSFFIPPTGVEVQPETGTKYVRTAVSPESLQYCVLRSESGEKRYVRGPAVVFPEPNEEFVTLGDTKDRVFKAHVLNPQMGIHLSVVEPYMDSDEPVTDPKDADHKRGEELFITGDDQGVYYPRAEHAIIKYRGQEEVHYAVVIPAGEGRYVLDKESGRVQLVNGPKMLLCDPRKEIIVLRPLSDSEVSLWFPNSTDALQVNAALREAGAANAGSYLSEATFASSRGPGGEGRFAGAEVTRRSAFTEPKSLTLDTKYKGAVGVNVWPGYAVQVVSKSGARKTVIGPSNLLLGYDETLAALELTTGTPKNEHGKKLRTVYLRVTANRVSDQVTAETSDLVSVTVTVSYRVNFITEKSVAWFNVEDYVGFMVDHLRSLIRNAVKRHGIEEFNRDAVSILRDAVLGKAGDEGAKRIGKSFDENGMHVYDLEVLDTKIGDAAIDKLIRGAEQEAVKATLDIEARRRTLELTTEIEDLTRKTAEEKTKTAIDQMTNLMLEAGRKLELDEAQRKIAFAAKKAELEAQWESQDLLDEIKGSELTREKAAADQANAIATARQLLDIALLEKKGAIDVERFKAIAPDLIAALTAFGNQDLMARFATTLKAIPMGLNEGAGEVMERLFKGTVLENVVAKTSSNGHASTAPAPEAAARR